MSADTLGEQLSKAIYFYHAGRGADAERLCREILAQEPFYSSALHLLGVILWRRGSTSSAENLVRQAISSDANVADYHNTLGTILATQGCRDEALILFEKATRLRSAYPEALNNSAIVLEELGRLQQAAETIRRSILYHPQQASAHDQLGRILSLEGEWSRAIDSFRRAVEIDPKSNDYLEHLASAQEECHRFVDAANCWRKIIKRNPTAKAYFRLGYVLHQAGRFTQAAAAQLELIRVDSKNPYAHQAFATTCVRRGQLKQALSHYRKALELKPQLSAVQSNLIYSMHHDADSSPPDILKEAREWGNRHEPQIIQLHENDRDPLRRLRIGYLSPDFRTHTIARLIAPVLTAHDRWQIEVYCYSAVARSDVVTQRLQKLTDHWREIAPLSTDAAAQLIRGDSIDILVDLTGHMAGNRLPVMAKKPAPVQIQLGFAGTTGLKAIDYRITDAYCDPAGQTEHYYTEQLLRLPCAWLYEPDALSPPAGQLPATSAGHLTFCSPNQQAKLTDSAIRLWHQVLESVPKSKLVVLGEEDTSEDNELSERFAAFGICSDRLEIFPRSSRAKYMKLFNRVDIVLDVFPFNGDTTTCDALWMGVPVVTLAGTSFHSRRGVSLLSMVGLTDLVAQTKEDYVKIAAQLASDLPRLAELRRELRSRMLKSPLTDAQGYTRALEKTYRDVWINYCHSMAKPAAHQTADGKSKPASIGSRELLRQNLKSALTLLQSQKIDEAIAHLHKCITREPSIPEYYNNLGCILVQAGQHDRAVPHFCEATKLRPNYAQAHNNLGGCFEQFDRLEDALKSYEKALASNPNYSEAHLNLSNVLRKLHRPEQAIASAKRAIQLSAKHPQALNSLGAALLENAQPAEAQVAFEEALTIDPSLGDIHANLATALLMQGKYEAGWKEYAWQKVGQQVSHTPQPWASWRDLDMTGKTVVISAEGGVGHVVQFARYAPLIAARGGKAIIKCQPSILPLLETIEGVHRVVEKATQVPDANIRIPQRCLPQLFGTTLYTISIDMPYLRPPRELVEKWGAQMQPITGFRVGVCWQGSQGSVHMRDRSFDSQFLSPLAGIRNVTLVNLQVGAKPSPDVRIVRVPGYDYERGDFLGLAAIIKNLDLVITCDTSIAHVSGALGMPTWVAVRFASEWRYMLHRDTCPWYPTMRLFRQDHIGEWESVFRSMADALRKMNKTPALEANVNHQ